MTATMIQPIGPNRMPIKAPNPPRFFALPMAAPTTANIPQTIKVKNSMTTTGAKPMPRTWLRRLLDWLAPEGWEDADGFHFGRKDEK